MAKRPLYCSADDESVPCPACGATADGNDPVRGVCQAIRMGPPPEPLVQVVLVDKRTGEIV